MNHLLISLQPDVAGQIEPLSYPLSFSQLLLDHGYAHASINIIPQPRTGRVIRPVFSLLTHFSLVLHDSGVMARLPSPRKARPVFVISRKSAASLIAWDPTIPKSLVRTRYRMSLEDLEYGLVTLERCNQGPPP